jgi:hypothetical protein
VAGKLKVVCYGGFRVSIGGLALLAFLSIEILIQIDINTDISVAIKADTRVLHRVFIRNIRILITLSGSIV